jgi:hypothetical protein
VKKLKSATGYVDKMTTLNLDDADCTGPDSLLQTPLVTESKTIAVM